MDISLWICFSPCSCFVWGIVGTAHAWWPHTSINLCLPLGAGGVLEETQGGGGLPVQRTGGLGSQTLRSWTGEADPAKDCLCCTITVTSSVLWPLTLWHVMQDLRLPSVTTIAIPEGYNWRELLTYIMKHHQMEMTGGLGPSIGMVSCSWCSGLYSGQINAFTLWPWATLSVLYRIMFPWEITVTFIPTVTLNKPDIRTKPNSFFFFFK